MNIRSKSSKWLATITLLAASLAVPLVNPTHAQTASNVSLVDTLNWLRDFLPNATGARDSGGVIDAWNSAGSNGCAVKLIDQKSFPPDAFGNPGFFSTETYEFSLAEIDSKSVTAYDNAGGGFSISPRSMGQSIRKSQSSSNGSTKQTVVSRFVVSGFRDRSDSERVANALRHAVDLCAKPQPF